METETASLCVSCQEDVDGSNVHIGDTEEDRICSSCFNRHFFMCSHCNRVEPSTIMETTQSGAEICRYCLDDDYIRCVSCREICLDDDAIDSRDGMICTTCAEDEFVRCEVCEQYVNSSEYDEDEQCCERCTQNIASESHRDCSSTDKFTTYKPGDIITSKRMFGVELEVLGTNYKSIKRLSDELPKEVGMVSDGSINGDYGIEIVSPRLVAREGEEILGKVIETIKTHSFSADDSCGYHVHLDCSDIFGGAGKLKKLKALVRTYATFEEIILAMLPKSRTEDNHYCQRLEGNVNFEGLELAQSLTEFEQVIYDEHNMISLERRKKNKYDDRRYLGINFHSLFYRGTLEIRYHFGTTKYDHVVKWAALHQAIIDKAMEKMFSLEQLMEMKNLRGLKKRVEHFFKLLDLAQPLKDYVIASINRNRRRLI